MKRDDKTREQLLKEMEKLNAKIAELEKTEPERKRVEKSLKENEEIYKGIIQSTASCIAVYKQIDNGKDFIFVDFNPMAEKVEQISKEKVIGKKVTKVFPGVKKFGLFKVFQNVWKTGKPEHFPVSVYQDDRIQGYRENYIYKLSSGEIVAVYQDLTERKRAEEELRIKEFAFNSSLSADSIGSSEGFLTHANPSFARIWGYENVDEVIDKPILDFLANKDEALEIIESITNTGKWEGEYTALRKDGSTFIARSSANAVYDAKGNQTALYSSVVDDTERKQAEDALQKSEAQLRQIIDAVPHMIFAKDRDGRFIMANKAVADGCGTTSENMIGKTHPELLGATPEQYEAYLNDDREVIDSGKLKFIPEENYTHPDGHTVIMETTKIPFTSTGIPAILGVSVDITKRKQAEEELEKHGEHLEELVEERTKELEDKNKELDQALKVFVGRELKIRDLQKRIRALEGKE